MEFWPGVVSTIVLSVFTNLISPVVSAFIIGRSTQLKQRRAQRVFERYLKIRRFRDDRNEFQIFVSLVLVRIAFFVGAGGFLYFYARASASAMRSLFGTAALNQALLSSMASFQSQATYIALIICAGAVLLCKQILDAERALGNFAAYEVEVRCILGEDSFRRALEGRTTVRR